MKKVKTIIDIMGIVVKYSAIALAIITGIQATYSELQKINFEDDSIKETE